MKRAVLLAVVMSVGSIGMAARQRDAAQQDATPRTAPAGTAVLSGQTVTADDAARPLRRVLVTLSGAEIRGDRQVMSDDLGRFAFEGLPDGRYTLMAEKPAYVTMHHGSARPGYGPGAPVALADGQTARVVLRMPRGAVIAGIVRTPSAQPIAGAQAQLSRVVSVGGQLRAVPVPGVRTGATTDEQGRFRFYGLPPGDYVIRGSGGGSTSGDIQMTTADELEAAARQAAQIARSGPIPLTPSPAAPPSQRVRYAAMYAPDSVDIEGAMRFRVAPGQEMLDVVITVVLVRTGAIAGVSLGPDGNPLIGVMVSVVNTRTKSVWTSPGMIRPDAKGEFRVVGLPEGEYALIGRAADPAVPQGSMSLFAETPFVMTGDDVSGLVVAFERGVTVSGRVELTGQGVLPSGLRVGLLPVGAIPGAAAAPAAQSLQPDGTFAFAGVAAGRYRLTATGAGNFSLRSALIGDLDTLDGSFEVAPRQDITGMRVVLTSQPTQLTGTLVDALGRPAPEFSVVVFSTDRAHWAAAPRRMSGLVKLDSRGAYRITGLPPGSYHLAAVTDAEPSELSDPAFLEQLAAAAVTFTLTEGQARTQDLKMRQ